MNGKMNVRMKYAASLLLLLAGTVAYGQKSERNYLRSGNKLFRDSLYVKAEVDYRKALDVNPQSPEALFNLGNALLMQQKGQEALQQFDAASKVEKNKTKLAKIYHNMGVLLQSAKQYPQCIEAYKQALRNNPADDETRYNLALARKQLKDQPQNNDSQQNQQNQEQKDDKQEQQQNQQEQNQNQQDDSQQPQQPEQQKDQMSKENAQQLLNAVMQDEKEVQDKVKKQLQVKGKKFDKDW